MAVPIWKDHYINLGSDEQVRYRIRVGSSQGAIIFAGRAYMKPGELNVIIRINDICADYMMNVAPLSGLTNGSSATFYVQKLSGLVWSSVETVEFTYDWSYDYDYNPATMGMAFPITDRIDERQWIIYTAYDGDEVTATIRFKDGTTTEVDIPLEIEGDFNDDYNNDFTRWVGASGKTAVFNLADYQNVESVTIGTQVYKVAGSCYRRALYYLNAYGGWDAFLVEGNSIETDNLTRHNIQTGYDNSDIMNRGKRNYLNEITKKFTLHSGLLLDHEAARMHHLLNSPQVFMLDIPSGKMLPVVLTNSTTDYKTFRTNGNRMVEYAIETELAQERIRR